MRMSSMVNSTPNCVFIISHLVADGKDRVMKPILVPYDENMTKEELLKAIADAIGSDVETVKKELCEPKTEPQTERSSE